MKSSIATAKTYKTAFKSGLQFTGFENGRPQFMGTDKQWEKNEELNDPFNDEEHNELLDEKLNQEYYDDMLDGEEY